MSAAQALKDALSKASRDEALAVMQDLLRSRPEIAPSIVGFACPDLTYAPARSICEQRAVGTLKSFSAKNGFGFISCAELLQVFGTDVFVHVTQMGPFATALVPGMPVTFAVFLSKDNKPQAYDVQPMDGMLVEAAQSTMLSGCGEAFFGLANLEHPYSGYGTKRKWKESNAELGRFTGQIKNFSFERGFGFIESEELAKLGHPRDVFLLATYAPQSCQAGQFVAFTAFQADKDQLRAKDLELL